MSKFNGSAKTKATITNYMGGKAFKQSEAEELVFSVATSFLEDSYYESKDDRLTRIRSLVKNVTEADPLFVAKLAIITRKEFNMRSAFHVLVGELTKNHKGDSLVRNTIEQGAERVDDLMEIAAYLGKPMPNQVKKGIRNALAKFSPYQLAKYKGDGKDYSLVDILNLVHPKPNQINSPTYSKLIKDELVSTDTWESRISAGQSHTEVWKDLLKTKKASYMSILRNLRNIVTKTDEETVKLATDFISDKEQIVKSKQLPFRFLSAYEALDKIEEDSSGIKFEKDSDRLARTKNALIVALTHSVENIPLLEGKTMILTDNSGSMRGDCGGCSALSAYSKRTTASIANLFAVLYWLRSDNTYVGVFGDRLEQPALSRDKDLFDNYNTINYVGERIGGGTEAGIFEAMRKLISEKTIVDRIMIFSDCQVGEGCKWYGYNRIGEQSSDFNRMFQEYKKINPNVLVYSVDLKGYGNKMFSDGVVSLAGWSNKIFDLMQIIEKKEGLVKWIQNYPVNL